MCQKTAWIIENFAKLYCHGKQYSPNTVGKVIFHVLRNSRQFTSNCIRSLTEPEHFPCLPECSRVLATPWTSATWPQWRPYSDITRNSRSNLTDARMLYLVQSTSLMSKVISCERLWSWQDLWTRFHTCKSSIKTTANRVVVILRPLLQFQKHAWINQILFTTCGLLPSP